MFPWPSRVTKYLGSKNNNVNPTLLLVPVHALPI